MHSVNAEEGEARSGDKEGPEGKRQPGRREGGPKLEAMCVLMSFFPEIAITQMRCWLEGR